MPDAISSRRSVQHDATRPQPALTPPVPPARRLNDDILYVGVNPDSNAVESAALARFARVAAVRTAPLARDYEAFVAALPISPEQKKQLAALLASTGLPEPLAQIAGRWAQGHAPSRLVVSGHSGNGDGVYGYDERTDELRGLELAQLKALAAIFPEAAAQVEDLHLSACSTGKSAGHDREGWLDTFPSLKTIWAYDGSAPAAPVGHLAAWARATAGRASTLAPAGGNVVVWSTRGGERASQRPLVELHAARRQADQRFDAYLSGRRVDAHHGSTLETDYRTYRSLAQRSDAAFSPAQRRAVDLRADQLLRVRYYEGGVRRELARAYAATIAAGYAAVGAPSPRFDRLSRLDALAEIARFDDIVRASGTAAPPAAGQLQRVLHALRDLNDRTIVPDSWCSD